MNKVVPLMYAVTLLLLTAMLSVVITPAVILGTGHLFIRLCLAAILLCSCGTAGIITCDAISELGEA